MEKVAILTCSLKLIKKIDGLNINFKFQDVSNDNYLKLHNLSNTSDLIVDESLLTTELNIAKILIKIQK